MASDALRIEDYAVIGDCVSAALVGRNGSVDWLCWPRFDSGACFAALLGTADHGRFLVAPEHAAPEIHRRYRDGSLVLETVFDTPEGQVALIDFMVPGAANGCIVRIAECRRGSVPMRMELTLRFDYGKSIPWVTKRHGGNGIVAIAGPEMVVLRTEAELRGEDMRTRSNFVLHEGERRHFVLTHCPSHLPVPPSVDPDDAMYATEAHWREWSSRCTYDGPWREAVLRSLLTLKCLTYAPTGGIVAAVTTSLPERIGGERNWDYRYCWLRDATLTLFAFLGCGYEDEATAWADWLHRAIAGSPEQLQIMYGLAGERRLPEWDADWLPGYEGSKPVHIGNAAATQLQLDVYGEVLGALHMARGGKLQNRSGAWAVQRELLDHLVTVWREPDDGLWETRGGRQQFTFSKIMAWVAFNHGIDQAEQHGLDGPLEEWRAAREEIHTTVCRDGFDPELNSFTQVFGAKPLDASLLLIAAAGFLPAEDERVKGTVAAIERTLMHDGFVLRYRTEEAGDGLPSGEGAFLACSFWMASAMHRQGRVDEAKALFERLVGLCNDVGLLSEEYDPAEKRFTGNIPQAFSHVALVTTALVLAGRQPSLRAGPDR